MLFNEFYYKYKYLDIYYTKVDPYKHFIEIGYKEFRDPIELLLIDNESYMYKYKIKNDEIKNHFIENIYNIKNDDIKLKKNILTITDIFNNKYDNIKFNWNFYVNYNKDLKYIKEECLAINHFINNGFKENRLFCQFPDDFNFEL